MPCLHGQLFCTSPKCSWIWPAQDVVHVVSTQGMPGREGKYSQQKKCELGSVRWIRDDPLDIVKWMDTWEVPVCTTIHLYVQGEEKGGGCRWTLGCERGWHTRPVHSVLVHPQQDCCRYGTVLLHFLEIETRKAFILHREAISAMQVLPMAHKEFVAELVCQHGDRHSSQQKSWEDCVPIVTDNDAVQKGTKGKRLFIHRLEVDSKRSDTPRKYQDCDVPLCLVVDRNCFVEASYCDTWLFYYEYCCYCCFLRVWFYTFLY